jgi:glycosyltransferase involved in cell wall biosynthesis
LGERVNSLLVSVIIPAYNEEKTIGETISKTILTLESLNVPYEIIVVDDGSTDRTRDIASSYNVKVLTNGRNKGKGYALQQGFREAKGEIIITLDADGSHNPTEIPRLMNHLFNGVDIVLGSRFLNGNGRNSTSKLNLVGNFIFNILIFALTKKLITDSQTGFRAYKKRVLKEIRLESTGYEIETELTIKGLKNGFTVKEEPISCHRRTFGVSKLSALSDGMKILKNILKYAFTAKYT